MGEVIPFKRPKPGEKQAGKTLCTSGFHKWEIQNDKLFDVKRGKLITVYKCQRCGEVKTKAH